MNAIYEQAEQLMSIITDITCETKKIDKRIAELTGQRSLLEKRMQELIDQLTPKAAEPEPEPAKAPEVEIVLPYEPEVKVETVDKPWLQKPRRSKFSGLDLEQLKVRLDNGESLSEICIAEGWNYSTIYNRLHVAGIKVPRHQKVPEPPKRKATEFSTVTQSVLDEEYGIRRYECPVCKKAFAPGSNWRYHRNNKSGTIFFCSWGCLRKMCPDKEAMA